MNRGEPMTTGEHAEKHSVIQSAGKLPAIASIDAIVLYGAHDGRVVHLHHIVAYEGVKRRSRGAQQQSAMEAAQRLGRDVEALKLLDVPDFQPTAKASRVDLRKEELVE